MKAILKSDRKVIIDVEPWVTRLNTLSGEPCYVDTKTGVIYLEDKLELVEYQGG